MDFIDEVNKAYNKGIAPYNNAIEAIEKNARNNEENAERKNSSRENVNLER